MTKPDTTRALVLACALLAACTGDSGRAERDGWSVLLVTLDTIRPDRIGCYGNARIATPNLDRLAEEGTLFENAFSPIPSTLPAHCSILTGTYPIHHGVHDNGVYFLEDAAVTVAERLSASGFATAAFVSAFVLDRQFNLNQGFDDYDDEMELPLIDLDPTTVQAPTEEMRRWVAQLASPYQRRADVVTDRAVEWLRGQSTESTFLWVHYFDPHLPYRAPPPFTTQYDPDYAGPLDGSSAAWSQLVRARQAEGGRLDPEHHAHMVARYDGEIAYLDHHLGRLFQAVRDAGRWDRTLVIVVGDHGESFGEHGLQTWEHNGSVFDEVLRVPFLIRRPDAGAGGQRVGGLVRTIDVAPTIFEWLDLAPPGAVQGESLLALTLDPDGEAPGEILVEARRAKQVRPGPHSWLGLRTNKFKLILKLDAEERVMRRLVYDVSVDPGERSPFGAGEKPRRVEALEERLRDRLEAFQGGDALPTRGLDELTSDALEALGYTGD